jgi:hypothetical protein
VPPYGQKAKGNLIHKKSDAIDHNAHSPQLFYAVGIETSSTHSSALAASFEKQIYSAMTLHMVNIP